MPKRQRADYMRGYRARKAKEPQKPRPFVAIDSEGVSYGDYKPVGDSGDLARAQRTVFWGAAGVDGVPCWLRAGDGAFLSSVEILDWLLELPAKFPNAIFIWFGSSYDATQLFVDLPYEKAWELQRGKPFPRYEHEPDVKARLGRTVFWREYAFSYIKQKCLTVGRLRNREAPRNARGAIQYSARITIFDVFGFFQTSFLKSAESIPGSIVGEEFATIAAGKKSRGDFSHARIDEMLAYTACELRVCARMLSIIRDKMESLDIFLQRWQGAGSIAGALLKREGAKKHFFPVVSKDLPDAQLWAHRAFFGGRIECLKQGRTERALWHYDVRSAYPFHMADLPSMEGGEYEKLVKCDRRTLQQANILSMFQLRLTVGAGATPGILNSVRGARGPHFYPLPYRDTRGAITYGPTVFGVYMQSEAAAAFAWLDYWRERWRRKTSYSFPAQLEICEAMIFHPGNSDAPFAWLRDMYAERQDIQARAKKTGQYDLAEKILKLGINSVYGKTAQSVGSVDRPPGTACPWYAAAITAGTRAQLLRAALTVAPENIVTFMTDGIVSTKKLAVQEGTDLGLWECEHISGPSFFVQPGVYFLGKKAKNRGIKRELLGVKSDYEMARWLDAHAVPGWRALASGVKYPYRYFLTLGAAVASPERWELAGHWVDGERELQLDNLGHKRAAPQLAREKIRRAQFLVDTIPKPAFFHDPDFTGDLPLSAPHRPDWLDADAGAEFAQAQEMEEIILARDL